MNAFLWGDGFRNIVRDFGRPVVRHWVGAGFVRGAAWGGDVAIAAKRRERLAPDVDPGPAVEQRLAALLGRAGEPGLHSAALGVDPRTWELVEFSLHGEGSEPAGATAYDVLHLSAPEIDALPVGRHW